MQLWPAFVVPRLLVDRHLAVSGDIRDALKHFADAGNGIGLALNHSGVGREEASDGSYLARAALLPVMDGDSPTTLPLGSEVWV